MLRPNFAGLASLFIATVVLPACGGMEPSGGKKTTQRTAVGGDATVDQSADAKTTDACKSPASDPSQALIEPLLDKYCTACHSGGTAPDLSSWDKAVASRAQVMDSVAAGRMPSGSTMPAKDKAAFAAWTAPALALQAADVPTYEGQVKAIIGPKCAWCHSATANAGVRQRPYLTSYETVRGSASNVIEEMQGGEMPPSNEMPQLDAGDTAIIEAWRTAGYPRGTVPPPFDPSAAVYYDATIEQLLAANCVGCHKAGVQAPNLDNYDDAATSAVASLAAIESGSMPPSGPMTTDEIATFKAWVDGGALFDAAGSTPPEATPTPEEPTPPKDPVCL